MPKGYLYTGCRWGQLHCVAQESELKSVGNAQDGYRQCTALRYTVQCACGKQFQIWASEFPGKRLMRDCGCGLGNAQTVSMRIGMPLDVIEIIRLYRAEEGNTMSSNVAIADLIKEGWASRLAGEKRE